MTAIAVPTIQCEHLHFLGWHSQVLLIDLTRRCANEKKVGIGVGEFHTAN